MGSTVGQVLNPQQPYMQNFSNAINQHAFNQQLGRGVSNQMYQPPRSDYDPYTASRRPNYMPYGPNQQFYQPIYQPSYSQFSPMGYGQAPFGGFYMPQRMGFGQKFSQPQRSLNDLSNFDMTGQGIFRNNPMDRNMMPPGMFGPATDISDQGQAALRQMPQQQDMFRPAADIFGPAGERTSVLSEPMSQSRLQGGMQQQRFQPMLSPQPMQSQYRPIPFASQTTIDQLVSQARSEGMSEGQAAAQAAQNASYGHKKGGMIEEGIDSLLKK